MPLAAGNKLLILVLHCVDWGLVWAVMVRSPSHYGLLKHSPLWGAGGCGEVALGYAPSTTPPAGPRAPSGVHYWLSGVYSQSSLLHRRGDNTLVST